MFQTFANLPQPINQTIATILAQDTSAEWVIRAKKLHERYMERKKNKSGEYVSEYSDALAYLALRTPATYAQIFGVLSQVKESVADWNPKSILDIGSGPGTGVWVAKTIFPSIETATCIDRNQHFVEIGKEIFGKSKLDITVSWQEQNIVQDSNKNTRVYDLVLISNVLNELDDSEKETLLNLAYSHTRSIMVIVEPGTPYGFEIVQNAALKFKDSQKLIAPYINNSFVQSNEYWIHFPQRFTRPEFQKRIRQHMREDDLIASDVEEAKYAYVAIGKIPANTNIFARCIGKVVKQKGFLEIPLLTKDGIVNLKVMKRHKEQYVQMKDLRWGEMVKEYEV